MDLETARRAFPRGPNACIRCSTATSPPRSYRITLFPGDGIGREVVSVAKDVLSLAGSLEGIEFRLREVPIGGSALDSVGVPLPEETLTAAEESDAFIRCGLLKDES